MDQVKCSFVLSHCSSESRTAPQETLATPSHNVKNGIVLKQKDETESDNPTYFLAVYPGTN